MFFSKKFRKSPPLQRNQNKYSGAVIWERLLFEKLKKSVIAFRNVSMRVGKRRTSIIFSIHVIERKIISSADRKNFNFKISFQKQIDETKSDEESDKLKCSAFNQYFAISQDMISYEKELFDRFLSEGTFVVNNVLKRNILKLKYISMPDDFKEEKSRKEPTPPTNLTRMQKTSRMQSRSKSSSVMGVMTPRKSVPQKSKFNVLSTAIQWMTSRHDTDNPDLALAEKLIKASASSTSLRSFGSKNHRESKTDFKITQAKCKEVQ